MPSPLVTSMGLGTTRLPVPGGPDYSPSGKPLRKHPRTPSKPRTPLAKPRTPPLRASSRHHDYARQGSGRTAVPNPGLPAGLQVEAGGLSSWMLAEAEKSYRFRHPSTVI